ncbi:larval cuticle protein A2B-like [Hetaerina americana]|uniref:larval cuticle protein A2B-like n=1 Tax=Hetaerina americana TaxID=62018 RepID=UPI003A7F4DBB
MAATYFILAAVVAVANAGYLSSPAYYSAPIAYHAPIAYQAPVAVVPKPLKPIELPKPVVDADFDPNPSYSFSYDVNDAVTGDIKSQSESLENGVVKGSYSLVDPAGIKRTVQYTADDISGFNAVINNEPVATVVKAPVVVKPVAPLVTKHIVAAAPAYYHAPIAYHAPITKVYAAPVAKVVSQPLAYSAYHPTAVHKVLHY